MKDIFKAVMPKEVFIQEGKVLDTSPEKVHREKTFDPSVLESLDYDNSTPLDGDGSPIEFDDRKRKRSGDGFANIIYKMMLDEMTDDVIFHYIKNLGVTISDNTLWDYIRSISTNNFPYRPRYYALKLKELCYPDEGIEKYEDIILQKHPIAAWVRD